MKAIFNQIIHSWPFLLGIILGIFFFLENFIGFSLSYFPGDLGDARFNMYILEHGYRCLIGMEEHFWSAPFMYPEPNIVTYSDNLLGNVPFYGFFRIIGFDLVTSFQLWIVVVVLLNYTSCYLFLKWLLKNKYAAVAGAFVFAFSIALHAQLAHVQVFPRYFIPLALWMLLLFKKNLNPKYFFWAVFFLVAQLYCGIYLGLFLIIPFAILIISILIIERRSLFSSIKLLKWWSGIIIPQLFNLFLLALLMLPYIESTSEGKEYETVIGTVPSIYSFFSAHQGSLIWSGLSDVVKDHQYNWDHRLFVGGIAMLSIVVSILILFFNKVNQRIPRMSKNIKLLMLVGVFTIVLFIRFDETSLYFLIFNLPGFNAMRSITRIINVELLFFGLAVGYLTHLLTEKFIRIKKFLFIILLGLLVIDNAHSDSSHGRTSKKDAQLRITHLKAKMKHIPEGSLVSYEPDEVIGPSHVYHIDAMLASQALNLKCVNGYSAMSPLNYDKFWREMNEETRLIWFKTKSFNPDNLYVIK